MAVARIKVAKTDHELRDVFWLRHQVYVLEEGYFRDKTFDQPYLYDRFDTLPSTSNIIAYIDDEPVGTLRASQDTELGLPAEEHFDFTEFRAEASRQCELGSNGPPMICSAGMLAVRKPWRQRRDVILAMFKLAAGLGKVWNCTHIIATVNAKSAAMYRRVEFTPLGNQQWIDEIGEHIIPMGSNFQPYFQWAFGDLLHSSKTFLGFFTGHLQRLLLGPGQTLFEQGEEGAEAYIVDAGTVRISTRTHGHDQTLATVGRGELLGEMALLDDYPRSATAETIGNTELIALSKEDFINGILSQPVRSLDILKILSRRLRDMNELTTILSQGAASHRMQHTLEDLKRLAEPDPKSEDLSVAMLGPKEFARSAGVSLEAAISYLELKLGQGYIAGFNDHQIRFHREPK